jgi:ATP phosphoribosyltransferase
MKNELIIGMPAGSLANPDRGGNVVELLENAGFSTRGYDTGGPTSFTTVNFLFGWDGRPQEFGSQLGLDELDVAIAGDDWIQERILEMKLEYNTDIHLEKALSLKRGGVKLVGIIYYDNDFTETVEFLKHHFSQKKRITVVSEMPYLALDWIQKSMKQAGITDNYLDFSVQKYKTPPRIEEGILIYETWGKTEAKIKNGGADIGLEITQSGSAIRNYGLKNIEHVFTSETGIWINPAIRNSGEKHELLTMFLLNLYGSVNAEKKVLLFFNVANNDIKPVEDYLSDNNLFADEPSITRGEHFSEYSIQVDSSDTSTPLARVRYELAKRKAVNIDTIPIESSIPSLDVIFK